MEEVRGGKKLVNMLINLKNYQPYLKNNKNNNDYSEKHANKVELNYQKAIN